MDKLIPFLEELKENLLREVDEKDPRFAKNKDSVISTATLGEIGEVLDSILHPYREDPITLEKIYSNFLNCDNKSIARDRKVFPIFKKNLIFYALNKIFSEGVYSKKELDLKTNNSYYSLGYNDTDFTRIKIGINKEIRVPSYFHIGIQNKSNKFVIKTENQYDSLVLNFIYEKGSEKHIDEFINYLEDWIKDNNFYKKAKITPDGDFLDLKNYDWNDVFLEEETKNQLTLNIVSFFEKEKIYQKNGISAKCGLIWEGPPGTGKTLTAKILANKLKDITFIWVTPDDVRGSRCISSIYSMARELSPSVVFFEDADLFCTDRGYGKDSTILGEIMNQLDGLVSLEGVVTIFTSNDPGSMEKALIDRPGRFDERIFFGPPNRDIIVSMMKKNLTQPEYDSSDLMEIAIKAEGCSFTGAHVKRLCDLATIYAINDNSLNKKDIAILKMEHFLKSLDKIKYMRIKAGSSDAKKKNTQQLGAIELPRYEHKELPKFVVKEEVEEEPKRKSLIRDILEKKGL